jgi:glycine/D-amino acid oxidase-like deaminating enzyme
MMPNMLPRVGKGAKPNVYYNTGHGHLGWTLSACTAEMIADIIQIDAKPVYVSTAIRQQVSTAQTA